MRDKKKLEKDKIWKQKHIKLMIIKKSNTDEE